MENEFKEYVSNDGTLLKARLTPGKGFYEVIIAQTGNTFSIAKWAFEASCTEVKHGNQSPN